MVWMVRAESLIGAVTLVTRETMRQRLHIAGDQLLRIMVDLIVVALIFLAARAISRFMQRRIWKRIPIDEVTPSTESFVNNSVALAIYAMAFTFTLAFLGASWATLLSAFTISTIAVVFGLADLLKSILGGAFLVFDRPYEVGDRIRIRDNEGEVSEIGVRTTTLVTDDHATVIVPNSLHLSEPFRNLDRTKRVSTVIRVIGIKGEEVEIGTLIEQLLGTEPEISGSVALSSNARHGWLDRMLIVASNHGIGQARRQLLDDPASYRARVVLQTDQGTSRETEAEAMRRLQEAFPDAIVSVRRGSLVNEEKQDVG